MAAGTDMVSAALVDLVAEFEGFRSRAYLCPAGVWTIGYGQTAGVRPGSTTTEARARDDLMRSLAQYRAAVCALITHDESTSPMLDAMTSLAYNIGIGALKNSTLLRLHNQRDYAGAAEQFVRWKHGGGRALPGLVKRRTEERQMYIAGIGYVPRQGGSANDQQA
jgi:lysozyme